MENNTIPTPNNSSPKGNKLKKIILSSLAGLTVIAGLIFGFQSNLFQGNLGNFNLGNFNPSDNLNISTSDLLNRPSNNNTVIPNEDLSLTIEEVQFSNQTKTGNSIIQSTSLLEIKKDEVFTIKVKSNFAVPTVLKSNLTFQGFDNDPNQLTLEPNKEYTLSFKNTANLVLRHETNEEQFIYLFSNNLSPTVSIRILDNNFIGKIEKTGSTNIKEKGFLIDETPYLVNSNLNNNQEFSLNLPNLECNKNFTIQAFASNDNGENKSEELIYKKNCTPNNSDLNTATPEDITVNLPERTTTEESSNTEEQTTPQATTEQQLVFPNTYQFNSRTIQRQNYYSKTIAINKTVTTGTTPTKITISPLQLANQSDSVQFEEMLLTKNNAALNNDYNFTLTAVGNTAAQVNGNSVLSQGGQFNLSFDCTTTTCPEGSLTLQLKGVFSNDQTPVATQTYLIPFNITHQEVPPTPPANEDDDECNQGTPNSPQCEDDDETPALPSPTLLTPADNATNVALRPTFTWQADTALKTNGKYKLKIYKSNSAPAANATPTLERELTATTYNLNTDLQENTKYYWTVSSEREIRVNNVLTQTAYNYPSRSFTTTTTRSVAENDLFSLDFPRTGKTNSTLDLKINFKDHEFAFYTIEILATKNNTRKILDVHCSTETDIENVQELCERLDSTDDNFDGPRTVTYRWNTNGLSAKDYDIRVSAITEDEKTDSETETITLTRSSSSSSSSGRVTPACDKYFIDMELGDPNCEAITYLRENGIFLGQETPQGRVANLRANLIRSEYFAIAARLRGLTGTSINTNYLSRFADITPNDLRDPNKQWWIQAVSQLSGIVRGYGDGTLRPTNLTTGVEIGKVAAESRLRGFRNNDNKQPWFTDTVNLYNQYGINLNDLPATRGDAVNILFNTLLIEQGVVTQTQRLPFASPYGTPF